MGQDVALKQKKEAKPEDFVSGGQLERAYPFTLSLASLLAEAIPVATQIDDGERRPICYC